jgi:hypothetical protein
MLRRTGTAGVMLAAMLMGAMLSPAVAATADTIQATSDDDLIGPGFPDPTREDCLRGGWMDPVYQGVFANQGACIRHAKESARVGG